MPAEPPAVVALRQPVGDLRIDRSTLKRALAQIPVAAGVRVVVAPYVDGLLEGQAERIELRLAAGPVIAAIDAVTADCFAGQRVTVTPAGDTIWVGGLDGGAGPKVVRTYDVGDLLPPPDAPAGPPAVPPPPTRPVRAPAFRGRLLVPGPAGGVVTAAPAPVPQTARQSAAALLKSRLDRLLGYPSAAFRATPRSSGVLHVFGGSLVVAAPEADQARVAALLADLRAEAARAGDERRGATRR